MYCAAITVPTIAILKIAEVAGFRSRIGVEVRMVDPDVRPQQLSSYRENGREINQIKESIVLGKYVRDIVDLAGRVLGQFVNGCYK